MKKLLSLIISAVIVAALAIGIIIGVKSYQDNKEYSLTTIASAGGTIDLVIDNSPYLVEPNADLSFTVKKKSKITMTAQPNENYSFINWELNGNNYSTQTVIDFAISQNSNIKAIFASKSFNVTITDTNFSETLVIDISDNLLQSLNSKYTAPAGYNYIYKLNEELVTADTKISDNVTITREKVLINYTVTFKNGDTQVGEVQTYNVENKTISLPETPEEYGYNLVWEDYNLDELKDIVVNTIKTPVVYTVTFKHNGEIVETQNYTIENKDITAPTLSQIDGYSIAWEDYNLDVLQHLIVNSVTSLINYTVTFKNGDTQVGEVQTYNVENKTIEVPNVPTETGYTFEWENYSLDNLGNIVVNAIKTPIDYTVTYALPDGFEFEDGSTTVNKIYHITNTVENVEKPSFENISVEDHYELSFPEFTLTYDESTPVVVSILKTPINYIVSFKNGDEILTSRTYNVENKSIEVPEIPDIPHYENEAWESFDLETLTNIDVNLNKTPIVYTITFKNEDVVIGTDTYTIENREIIAPAVPDVPHYQNEKWPTIVFPEDLGNFDVQLKKSITNYFVNYTLPAGYGFQDSTSMASTHYTIKDFDAEQGKIIEKRPPLPSPRKGYSLEWEDVTLTIDSLGVITEIKAIESLITYTAEFKHDGELVSSIEYNVNTINSVVSPATPTVSGFIVKWEPYNITSDNIDNFVINSIKLVKVKVNYIIDDFAIAYEHTDRDFTNIYLAIDSESKVVTDGSNPIIYKIDETDTKKVAIRTGLFTTISTAVHNPDDDTDKPIITRVTLLNGSGATVETANVDNSTYAAKINEMFTSCTTNNFTLNITYEDPSIE